MPKNQYITQNLKNNTGTLNDNSNGTISLGPEELIMAQAQKNERQQQLQGGQDAQPATKAFTQQELSDFAANIAEQAAAKTREEFAEQINTLTETINRLGSQTATPEPTPDPAPTHQQNNGAGNPAPAPVSTPNPTDQQNNGTGDSVPVSRVDQGEQMDWQAKALELNTQLQAATQANQQLNENVQQLQKDVASLSGLSGLYGISNPGGATLNGQDQSGFGQAPNLNLNTNPLQGPVGDVKTLTEMMQAAPAFEHQNPKTGMVAVQRDLKPVRNMIARLYRDQVANGTPWYQTNLYQQIEKTLKNEGLLRGNYVGTPMTNAAGPTIGTPASVGVLYLDILAQWMRETHNAHNIWWQMVMQVYNPTTVPSLTMGIPRWEFLDEADDITDYLLATTTTYNASQLSVGTGTDSQALTANTVPVAIAEWGLGRGVNVETRPVFIPEFHEQTSLLPLMTALDTRLMQSYYKFENKKIRLEYEKSTVIYYNDNGGATLTAADVGTGDDGTCSQTFMSSMYTQLYANQIPTLPDGRYIAVLNPFALNQYKASLEKMYAPVTEEQRQAISNVLGAATGVEIGRVNGYFGDYNNFHIFGANDFGVGAAGSVPTVNDVVFGASTQTCVDSFFFGPGCVGRGIALPAEIRASGTNPFGRGESYIWLSREETAPIDLDVSLDPNQQTRCFRGRTSLVAV